MDQLVNQAERFDRDELVSRNLSEDLVVEKVFGNDLVSYKAS